MLRAYVTDLCRAYGTDLCRAYVTDLNAHFVLESEFMSSRRKHRSSPTVAHTVLYPADGLDYLSQNSHGIIMIVLGVAILVQACTQT